MAFAYSLGKAQRILAGLAEAGELPGPIYTHGFVRVMTEAYRATGVVIPETISVTATASKAHWAKALIVCRHRHRALPGHESSATGLVRFRFGLDADPGTWRRRSVDRGFVLSRRNPPCGDSLEACHRQPARSDAIADSPSIIALMSFSTIF